MKKSSLFLFALTSVFSGIGYAGAIYSNGLESGAPLKSQFYDINNYGGGFAELTTEKAHSGSYAIKINYPVNEAGTEIKPVAFPATPSLFTRKYEYYAPGWEGNWPVGLKTSRYFTTPDYKTTTPQGNYAYMSEKLIWQTYSSTCNEQYGMGMNNAIFNKDLEYKYLPSAIYGNGLPYIRTGHWYRFETWMVLNSAVDVADGVLKIWIDGVLVYSNEAVMWKSTARGVTQGDGWQSMWFGGNYSGAICGEPTTPLVRYIDDLYLSTTLDLLEKPAAPLGFIVK